MTRNTFSVAALLLVLSFAVLSLAAPSFRFHKTIGIHGKRNFALREGTTDAMCQLYANAPCRKSGQSCGCFSASECSTCNDGLSCHNGFCEPNGDLGESCSIKDDCYHRGDHNYACNTNGQCAPSESNIFQAGEPCYPNNTIFANGGCETGLTCSNTTSRCTPHVAIGELCSETEASCGVGAFCSSTTWKCTPLLGENATCADQKKRYGSENVCQPSLSCIGGKCTKHFSRDVGEACQQFFMCKHGLLCTTEYKADQVGTCQPIAGLNERCTNDSSVCGEGSTCYCDFKTKQARCVSPVHSPALTRNYEKYLACLEKNGLEDGSLFHGNKHYEPNAIAAKCGKQAKATWMAQQTYGFGLIKYCSSASSLLFSVPLAVLAALVILM